MNKLITIMIMMIMPMMAQDITNKLGGDTANETYDVSDSNDNVLFRVQGDGKVGIGIDTPNSKLCVGGDGNNQATIYGEASTGRGVQGFASNTGALTNYGGYFWANGLQGYGVYGKSIGDYGCGVYGEASSNSNSDNYGGYFLTSGSYGSGVYARATNIGNYENYGGQFSASGKYSRGAYGYTNGSNGYGLYGRAPIGSGKGVVGEGSGYDFDAIGPGLDYGSTSSIRWKQNIIEIDKPLEKLSKLRGVYFDWDEEHDGGHDIGCIAEEVGKVLPEIVVYEENGIDADGMDYSKLTPLLIEAIKAQQNIIEDLQNRITALENH